MPRFVVTADITVQLGSKHQDWEGQQTLPGGAVYTHTRIGFTGYGFDADSREDAERLATAAFRAAFAAIREAGDDRPTLDTSAATQVV